MKFPLKKPVLLICFLTVNPLVNYCQIFIGLNKPRVRALLMQNHPKCIMILNTPDKLHMQDISNAENYYFDFNKNGLCYRSAVYYNKDKKGDVVKSLSASYQRDENIAHVWYQKVRGKNHKTMILRHEMIEEAGKLKVFTKQIYDINNWR